MVNPWEAGKHKVLDVWRRAPTLVTVVGIAIFLICSMSCICGGCMSSFFRGGGERAEDGDKSGKSADSPPSDRPAAKGTG